MGRTLGESVSAAQSSNVEAELPLIGLQRWLGWFGHAARREQEQLIRDEQLMRHEQLAKPPTAWRRGNGATVKSWSATLKEDLVTPSVRTALGARGWNRNWVAVSCELAPERHSGNGVKAKEETSATKPIRCPLQQETLDHLHVDLSQSPCLTPMRGQHKRIPTRSTVGRKSPIPQRS